MTRTINEFQRAIAEGIPNQLPPKREVPTEVNRAPKRKDILSAGEKRHAMRKWAYTL